MLDLQTEPKVLYHSGVFISDFARSPFAMMIHTLLPRTPLLSTTLRQGVGRGKFYFWDKSLGLTFYLTMDQKKKKNHFSAVNGGMDLNKMLSSNIWQTTFYKNTGFLQTFVKNIWQIIIVIIYWTYFVSWFLNKHLIIVYESNNVSNKHLLHIIKTCGQILRQKFVKHLATWLWTYWTDQLLTVFMWMTNVIVAWGFYMKTAFTWAQTNLVLI